ncbi:hypothetical protein [Symbiopectobacterium sp. RP]|uniref:hypothetical protein n=1 Tax=Symbiopectobacterium sp. RP TaxID=3248553 RepID=UPI003D285018
MITANALICGKKIQLIVIKIISLGYIGALLGTTLFAMSLFKILCKCLSSEVTVKTVTELDNKATHCHTQVL